MDEETLTAQITVKNTGSVAGLETVQVYFCDMVSSVMTPMKNLIAYQQVELQPGESKEITFQFDKMDFSFVNRKEERIVEPGEFVLMIGHSSKDEDLLKVTFTL